MVAMEHKTIQTHSLARLTLNNFKMIEAMG
jgi:hypothetical protein